MILSLAILISHNLWFHCKRPLPSLCPCFAPPNPAKRQESLPKFNKSTGCKSKACFALSRKLASWSTPLRVCNMLQSDVGGLLWVITPPQILYPPKFGTTSGVFDWIPHPFWTWRFESCCWKNLGLVFGGFHKTFFEKLLFGRPDVWNMMSYNALLLDEISHQMSNHKIYNLLGTLKIHPNMEPGVSLKGVADFLLSGGWVPSPNQPTLPLKSKHKTDDMSRFTNLNPLRSTGWNNRT